MKLEDQILHLSCQNLWHDNVFLIDRSHFSILLFYEDHCQYSIAQHFLILFLKSLVQIYLSRFLHKKSWPLYFLMSISSDHLIPNHSQFRNFHYWNRLFFPVHISSLVFLILLYLFHRVIICRSVIERNHSSNHDLNFKNWVFFLIEISDY